MYYLTQREKNEVTRECGVTAMVLYDYYVSKAFSEIDFGKDETVAKALALSTQIIKRNRLMLTQHNYYHRARFSKKTDSVIINYIGKEPVLIIKFFGELFGKDYTSVSKVQKHVDKLEIKDIIHKANLSQQDQKDLHNLFGIIHV